MGKELKTTVRFERSLVSEGGDSIRYLIVELSAASKTKAELNTPLNIAIVIDSSRSMYGSRLQSALKAAEGIISCLTDDDFVSVVSFSNDAQVHVDGLACNPRGKESALKALKKIEVRAGTNISGGWFKGAECVGTVMLQHPNMKNHVVILSDGYANQGTLDPSALAHHANELQMRGVSVSAVGIGDDYSTSQIYSVAQYGGGRVHHAAHSPEIVEVVMGEFDELRERSIENLKVEIEFPSEVMYKSLNIIPTEMDQNKTVCIFGGLSAGRARSAIFRVCAPEGKKNEELKFVVKAKWRNSGQAQIIEGHTSTGVLKYVDPTKNSFQPVDDEVALRIAHLWQSYVVFQATNLNRRKEYSKLEQFLNREIKYYKRYCKTVPQACVLMSHLVQLSLIANEDWDEASRKEIQTSTYTNLYGLTDTRSGARKKWQEYTGQFTRPPKMN